MTTVVLRVYQKYYLFLKSLYTCIYVFNFKTGTPVSQVGVEFAMLLRLALNFLYSCLSLWSTRITGGCHHAQISFLCFPALFQLTNSGKGMLCVGQPKQRHDYSERWWARTFFRKNYSDVLLPHKTIFPGSSQGKCWEGRKGLLSILASHIIGEHLTRL